MLFQMMYEMLKSYKNKILRTKTIYVRWIGEAKIKYKFKLKKTIKLIFLNAYSTVTTIFIRNYI